MGKNDFDIDFDFEKEYGFDPKDVLGNEELIEDVNEALAAIMEAGYYDALYEIWFAE